MIKIKFKNEELKKLTQGYTGKVKLDNGDYTSFTLEDKNKDLLTYLVAKPLTAATPW